MSESQRERELHRGSVGFCPLAGEIEHPGIPYSGFLERMRIEGGVAAVEDQHRETLTHGEKVAMIGAERKRACAVRHDFFGLGDFKDFDVTILQLHNAVVRAPRMTVARADGEAGAALEFRRRVEIADGVHDMVEAVRHFGFRLLNAGHFNDENAVGTSS